MDQVDKLDEACEYILKYLNDSNFTLHEQVHIIGPALSCIIECCENKDEMILKAIKSLISCNDGLREFRKIIGI